MTRHDVREYLEKIYNLPVREVRTLVNFLYDFHISFPVLSHYLFSFSNYSHLLWCFLPSPRFPYCPVGLFYLKLQFKYLLARHRFEVFIIPFHYPRLSGKIWSSYIWFSAGSRKAKSFVERRWQEICICFYGNCNGNFIISLLSSLIEIILLKNLVENLFACISKQAVVFIISTCTDLYNTIN